MNSFDFLNAFCYTLITVGVTHLLLVLTNTSPSMVGGIMCLALGAVGLFVSFLRDIKV